MAAAGDIGQKLAHRANVGTAIAGVKKRKQLKEVTVAEHYAGLLDVREPQHVSEVTREPEIERMCFLRGRIAGWAIVS